MFRAGNSHKMLFVSRADWDPRHISNLGGNLLREMNAVNGPHV